MVGVAILLVRVCLGAAAPAGAPGAVAARLVVRVRSGSAPIPGAEITVDGSTSSSDAAGEATLQVSPGRHDVSASRLGFRPAAATIDAREGEEVAVVLQLTPLELPTD